MYIDGATNSIMNTCQYAINNIPKEKSDDVKRQKIYQPVSFGIFRTRNYSSVGHLYLFDKW